MGEKIQVFFLTETGRCYFSEDVYTVNSSPENSKFPTSG